MIHIKLWGLDTTSFIENYLKQQTLRRKWPYSELFWSAFSRIRTGYGEILRISPYSVRMRENTDQDNSEYGHFSRSEMRTGKSKTPMHSVIWFKIDVKLILITDISISTIWGSYATTFLSWGLILHHKKFVVTYSKTANLCCSLVDELIQWHLQKL